MHIDIISLYFKNPRRAGIIEPVKGLQTAEGIEYAPIQKAREFTMEQKNYELVDGVEKLESAIAQVREAQRIYSTYTQEQVDKIFKAAATAAGESVNGYIKKAVDQRMDRDNA